MGRLSQARKAAAEAGWLRQENTRLRAENRRLRAALKVAQAGTTKDEK